MFNILWLRGRRRSASTNSTLRPSSVNTMARLMERVDLPSPGSHEVTSIVFGGWSGDASSTEVRRLRNASATCERGWR